MYSATTYSDLNEHEGREPFCGRVSVFTNLILLSNLILIGIILIISLIIIG